MCYWESAQWRFLQRCQLYNCLSVFRWIFSYLAIFNLSKLWGSTIFNCVLVFPLYIKMNSWGIETHQGGHKLTNMVWFGKFNAFWMLGCWIKNLMSFHTTVYMLQQNDHHEQIAIQFPLLDSTLFPRSSSCTITSLEEVHVIKTNYFFISQDTVKFYCCEQDKLIRYQNL